MKNFQTAERVSHSDLSDNFVFQRSILAYIEASKYISGDVLEIGTGSGYGVEIIAPKAHNFVTIDKHQSDNLSIKKQNVKFIQMNVPPLRGIGDTSFDFVITFQVIEHIKDDDRFVNEIHRVLKPSGKLIVTTPNRKMSLTRNPWHVREYTVHELENLLLRHFRTVTKLGVYGNDKINKYYAENKLSVEKITKWDIFNLQYLLPRQILQVPYDILNRMNRRKLLQQNTSLVSDIKMDDYRMDLANDMCYDLFYIAEN